MVKTGYISFIVLTGGGFDGDGNPILPVETPTDFIDCNLKTVTREYKFMVDGQYIQAKYSVYVEQRLVDALAIDLTVIKNIKLQDNNGNLIGTFQIHNLEYLNLTSKIKVIV
jgi:hypothetical protein